MTALTSHLIDLGKRWLDELEIRPSTRRAYEFEVRRFARWAGGSPGVRLSALPGSFLTEFLTLLAATDQEKFARVGLERAAKASSLLQAKRILAAFFDWAGANSLVPAAVGYAGRRWHIPEGRAVPTPKATSRPRRKSVKAGGSEQARNEFILALARWAGARPKDIASLRRSDVSLRGSVLRVRLPNGKNALVDTYLPPVAANAWKALQKIRPRSAFAVSRSGNGEPLTPSRIARIIAELGIESENARALRSEGIRQFHGAGWPDQTIRAQMRRNSMQLGIDIESQRVRIDRVRKMIAPGALAGRERD